MACDVYISCKQYLDPWQLACKHQCTIDSSHWYIPVKSSITCNFFYAMQSTAKLSQDLLAYEPSVRVNFQIESPQQRNFSSLFCYSDANRLSTTPNPCLRWNYTLAQRTISKEIVGKHSCCISQTLYTDRCWVGIESYTDPYVVGDEGLWYSDVGSSYSLCFGHLGGLERKKLPQGCCLQHDQLFSKIKGEAEN